MMQKSQSLKVTHTSQLKKDKIESSKVVSSKQSIIVKQILDLVSQQNQEGPMGGKPCVTHMGGRSPERHAC